MSDQNDIDAQIEAKAKIYRASIERDPSSQIERQRINDVYRTYTSNAIEGSTLTERETAALIEKGTTAGGKPLNDHLDALATMDAISIGRQIAREDRPFNLRDIREIHQAVVSKTRPEIGGEYAKGNRGIAGKDGFLFPGPEKIAPLMTDFGDWLQTAGRGPDNAISAHVQLVSIHPFADGNGRTSRILMNSMLERDGYPAVSIDPAKHRDEYIDALDAYSHTGDDYLFNRFIKERMVDSLDRANSFLERNGEQRADREVGKAVSAITGISGKVSFKDLTKSAEQIADPDRRAAAENMIRQLQDRTNGQTADLPKTEGSKDFEIGDD